MALNLSGSWVALNLDGGFMGLGARSASGKVEANVFLARKPGAAFTLTIKKPTRPLVYGSWSARRLRIPDGEIDSPIALGMP